MEVENNRDGPVVHDAADEERIAVPDSGAGQYATLIDFLSLRRSDPVLRLEHRHRSSPKNSALQSVIRKYPAPQ